MSATTATNENDAKRAKAVAAEVTPVAPADAVEPTIQEKLHATLLDIRTAHVKAPKVESEDAQILKIFQVISAKLKNSVHEFDINFAPMLNEPMDMRREDYAAHEALIKEVMEYFGWTLYTNTSGNYFRFKRFKPSPKTLKFMADVGMIPRE